MPGNAAEETPANETPADTQPEAEGVNVADRNADTAVIEGEVEVE